MRLPLFYSFLFLFTINVSCSNESLDSTNNNPETNNPTKDTTVNNTPTDVGESTASSIANPTTINGSYSMGEVDGEDGGGYLVLQVMPDDSIKFELDINNGAPNYHSGTAAGKMGIKGGIATFQTNEFDALCSITFTIKGNKVSVEQVQGNDFDCGFGQGVTAYGMFTKQTDEVLFKYEGAK